MPVVTPRSFITSLLAALLVFVVVYVPPTQTTVLIEQEPIPASSLVVSRHPSAGSGELVLLPVGVMERALWVRSIPSADANPLMWLLGQVRSDARVYPHYLPRPSSGSHRIVPLIVALQAANESYVLQGGLGNISAAYGDDVLSVREHRGSSGGLGIALEAYGRITGEDLTRGRTVAGVGTLTADGTVLPVGGFPLKVRAAERAGVDLILASAGQQRVESSVPIVYVDDFSAARAALG